MNYLSSSHTLKMFTRTLVVASALLALVSAGSAFADSEKASPHCTEVGGAFVTNFISDDQTAGTATGDLKGALGVKIVLIVSGRYSGTICRKCHGKH